MKFKLRIVLFFLLLLSCRLMANPEWMWIQHQADSAYIAELTTVTDSTGNYYTSFRYGEYVPGKLIKYNLFGETVWVKELVYPNLQISITPYKMHMDRFNNIYIFGLSNNQICLAKLNLDGEIIWFRHTTNTVSMNYTELKALTSDYDGNPIIVFVNYQNLILWCNTSSGRRVAKFNGSGDFIDYIDPVSLGGGARGVGIVCDSLGYTYLLNIVGVSGATYGQRVMFKIKKFDQELNIVADVNLFYFDFSSGYPVTSSCAIDVANDSSIVISGYADRTYYAGSLYLPEGGWFTAKLNPDFTFQWVVPYGGSDLYINPDDSISLGYSLTVNSPYCIAKVTKLEPSGTLLYSKSISLTNPFITQRLSSMVVDVNGDCVISVLNEYGAIQGEGIDLNPTEKGFFMAKLGEPKGVLTLNQNDLDLGISSPGYQSNTQPIVLKNEGTGDLQINGFAFSNYSDIWQVTLPLGFVLPYSLEPRDSLIVQMSFTPQAVASYQDTLRVQYGVDSLAEGKVRIRGQGVNAFPAQVQNVNISQDGYDMLVTWDPTTSSVYNTPLEANYYFIYGSHYPNPSPEQQIFVGYSSGTSFRHIGVGLPGYNVQGPRMYFYQVTAVVLYRDRELCQSLDSFIGLNRQVVWDLLK